MCRKLVDPPGTVRTISKSSRARDGAGAGAHRAVSSRVGAGRAGALRGVVPQRRRARLGEFDAPPLPQTYLENGWNHASITIHASPPRSLCGLGGDFARSHISVLWEPVVRSLGMASCSVGESLVAFLASGRKLVGGSTQFRGVAYSYCSGIRVAHIRVGSLELQQLGI